MPISFSDLSGGGGAGGSNGFTLFAGDATETTFTLSSPQPAGFYLVTSELGDIAFDIYFISEAGENVGYSNSRTIEATDEFDTIVLYSSAATDVWTFEPEESSLPTGVGAENSGSAPYIVSTNVRYLPSADDSIAITGGNFASSAAVYFTGSDNVVRAAKSVTVDSVTQVTAVRPDVMPAEYSPYSVRVTNTGITDPSTNVNILADHVSTYIPIVSSAIGSTAWLGTPYSSQLSTTVGVGATPVTYAVTTGVLPTGLTLSSSGLISGTSTDANNTVRTFTVTATDSYGGTDTQEFTITSKTPVFTASNAPANLRTEEGLADVYQAPDGGYVTKHNFSSGGPSQGGMGFTKFTADKTWQWTRTFSWGYYSDYSNGLAVTSAGDIYWAAQGSYTGIIGKLDSSGNLVWAKYNNNSYYGSGFANSAGYTCLNAGVNEFYWTAFSVLGPSGDVLLIRRLDGANDGYSASCVSSDGAFAYFGKGDRIVKYSVNGTPTYQWGYTLAVSGWTGSRITSIKVDEVNNWVYVGVSADNSGYIFKLSNTDGSVISVRYINAGTQGFARVPELVIDGSDVYVLVVRNMSTPPTQLANVIYKFDSNMNAVWSREITYTYLFGQGLAVDNGFVALAARTANLPTAMWFPKSTGGNTGTTAAINGYTYSFGNGGSTGPATSTSTVIASDPTSGRSMTWNATSPGMSSQTKTYSTVTL